MAQRCASGEKAALALTNFKLLVALPDKVRC